MGKHHENNTYCNMEWMTLAENERRMTDAEKNVIRTNLEKQGKTQVILFAILIITLVMLDLLLSYSAPSSVKIITNGMVLIPGGILLFNLVWYAIRRKKRMLYLLDQEDTYVREAIFRGSNKYMNGCFEVKEKGEFQLYFHQARMAEKIAVGEKVILLRVGGVDWMYRMRSEKQERV